MSAKQRSNKRESENNAKKFHPTIVENLDFRPPSSSSNGVQNSDGMLDSSFSISSELENSLKRYEIYNSYCSHALKSSQNIFSMMSSSVEKCQNDWNKCMQEFASFEPNAFPQILEHSQKHYTNACLTYAQLTLDFYKEILAPGIKCYADLMSTKPQSFR
jgi:hypothetical protein